MASSKREGKSALPLTRDSRLALAFAFVRLNAPVLQARSYMCHIGLYYRQLGSKVTSTPSKSMKRKFHLYMLEPRLLITIFSA